MSLFKKPKSRTRIEILPKVYFWLNSEYQPLYILFEWQTCLRNKKTTKNKRWLKSLETRKEFKYEMLIRRSKEIASEYTIKLTIRQVYYRLVSNLDIDNNRSQYVYFDKALTVYRQKNLEFADLFKDETRKIVNTSEIDYPYFGFNQILNERLTDVQNGYPKFTYNENLLQDKVNIILLEKDALRELFEQSITPNTIIIVSRGLNSFTQMNDLKNILTDDNRELKLYTFTDFDDTGYLIQDNFIKQMRKYLNIEFDSFERIALTNDLIEKYSIPINPEAKKSKQAKSTHKDYGLPHFVELDAIEPKLLMDLVNKTCKQNFNQDLFNSIEKTFNIRNRRLKTKYFKELKKIDLSKL